MPVDVMSAEATAIRVAVVYALPEQAWTMQLDMPRGTTVAEAVERSGLATQVPGFDTAALTFAIYGKAVTPETLLREGDRVELLRPLLADPKQARRRRARGT